MLLWQLVANVFLTAISGYLLYLLYETMERGRAVFLGGSPPVLFGLICILALITILAIGLIFAITRRLWRGEH